MDGQIKTNKETKEEMDGWKLTKKLQKKQWKDEQKLMKK